MLQCGFERLNFSLDIVPPEVNFSLEIILQLIFFLNRTLTKNF
jgi:hypothetical protein